MAAPEAMQMAIDANMEFAQKSAQEMSTTLRSPNPEVWPKLDMMAIKMKEAQRIHEGIVKMENAAAVLRIAESVGKLAVNENEETWFTAGLASGSRRERAVNERVIMEIAARELQNGGIDMIRLVTGKEVDRIVVGYGSGKYRRYSQVGVSSDNKPSYSQVVVFCMTNT